MAFLLPFLGSFAPSPCVRPSVRLSSDFAPFPCVFLAFSCLALRFPFRRLDFKLLFEPFTAFFRSARAIYQGNKKALKRAIFEAFCVRGVSASVRA